MNRYRVENSLTGRISSFRTLENAKKGADKMIQSGMKVPQDPNVRIGLYIV
jgi:hypothetical protein